MTNAHLPPAEQLHSTLPGLNREEPAERPDPAIELNERLRKRSIGYTVRKIFFRVFLAVLVALLGFGGMVYATAMRTMTTDTVTDYRDCKWQIGKFELTGKRSYTYPYHDVFGIRFIDKSRMTEQTTINIPRDATTVVTINDSGNWFGDQQDEGPAGTMKLKPGKMYVVVSGKNYGAFDHDSFCTQQPKKEL